MTQHERPDGFLADMTELAGDDAIETLSGAFAPAQRRAANPAARARLLDAAMQPGRLWRFDRTVAELLDLSLAAARALLDRLDEPAAWVELLPGVALCWVAGGARVHGAMTGFMRIAAGVRTLEHEHLGIEELLVLQGACREIHSGRIMRAGELLRSEPGSTHTLEAVAGGPDLVQLSVAHGGLRVGGHCFTPPTR